MSNIIEENAALQQQWCCPLLRWSKPARKTCAVILLLFADRVTLPSFPVVPSRRLRNDFFATKNNLLKQKDVIFSVNFHLHHHEDIVENKLAEVREVVAFPVLNTSFEALDSLYILLSALRFVNSIGDSFCGIPSAFEFFEIRVIGTRRGFNKRLSNRVINLGIISSTKSTYAKQ